LWTLDLSGRRVEVETEGGNGRYMGTLDAGVPTFHGAFEDRAAFAGAFSLVEDDFDCALPLEVASTGLRYLVTPLRPGRLERARIAHDLTEALRAVGAQFAVLFDPAAREIRHWNNDGVMEDVATGSAAGVVAAYSVKHGLANAGETIALAQGRFAGRPSELRVRANRSESGAMSVQIAGAVCVVGRGELDHAPEATL
jgi:PhzF family phenazine biosynthesis protein